MCFELRYCCNHLKMTMTQSEQLQHGPHEKVLRDFEQDFNLNEPAELQQQPDLQFVMLKDQCHTAAHEGVVAGGAQDSQYSEVPGRMEEHKDHHSEEAQVDGEGVPQAKPLDGCVDDHLLILAQSAEIVAQSEDGLLGMCTNNQIIGLNNNLAHQMTQENVSNATPGGQECSCEVSNSMSVYTCVSSQRSEFCDEVTGSRLTQIRKQARCKYLLLDQGRIVDSQCKHIHGNKIRLSQMKHQARCKGKNVWLPQETIRAHKNEQPHGRITRLSQIKHQARSKHKSTVKEGTEEHMYEHLRFNNLEGNQIEVASTEGQKKTQTNDFNLSVVEGVPAHKFLRGSNHSSVASQEDGILRELQRFARRLRVLKTRERRQQLKTECIGNSVKKQVHTTKISPIGLTRITNPQLLHYSSLLKDKDLNACQQELPKTFRYNEKLRENFGAEKAQGHLESNGSLGPSCKYHQHISNALPMQNDVLSSSFTKSPNHMFRQTDTNMRWVLYMHQMQLREYHRIVARQRRAERIESKRASKDRDQYSKNPVQNEAASMADLHHTLLNEGHDSQHLAYSLSSDAKSETQKEFAHVKGRMRLTQLRREVRLGTRIQCSVMQGPREN